MEDKSLPNPIYRTPEIGEYLGMRYIQGDCAKRNLEYCFQGPSGPVWQESPVWREEKP